MLNEDDATFRVLHLRAGSVIADVRIQKGADPNAPPVLATVGLLQKLVADKGSALYKVDGRTLPPVELLPSPAPPE